MISGEVGYDEVRLAPETVETLARRIAELLAEGGGRSGVWLVDVEGLSRVLDVQSRWVYEHATELGAIRLGEGRRPRLRFDPEEAVDTSRFALPRTSWRPTCRLAFRAKQS